MSEVISAIKGFLKFISPVQIFTVDESEVDTKSIDNEYQSKFEDLSNQETMAKTNAGMLAAIVQLCHVAALAALSVEITKDHPDLVRKLETNTEDNELLAELQTILKDRNFGQELDSLGIDILTLIYERYPALGDITDNRIFSKGEE